MLSVRAEIMEAEAVKDGTIDLPAYGALTDQLGRVFNRLGLKRAVRLVDVSPLAEHFSRPFSKGAA